MADAESMQEWEARPVEMLVEHILTRYHAPLQQQLDGVIAAADRVEEVHADAAECPRGLAELLRVVRIELMSHMAKEEGVLFPALVAGRRGPMLGGPVSVMMREHEEHDENLARLRTLTNDFTPPADACGTWRGLYEELARLDADLKAHIALENHVLFPRALNGR